MPLRFELECRIGRGKVTNSVAGAYHVILLQETESHLHEVTNKMTPNNSTSTTAQINSFCFANTSELGGAMTEKVILGVKPGLLRLGASDGLVDVLDDA